MRTTLRTHPILALALVGLVAACAGTSSTPGATDEATMPAPSVEATTPAGTASAGPTPPAPASGAPVSPAIALRQTPPGLGCDAIGWEGEPYRALTFHVDPAATDPVWATADTGAVLQTYWPVGFRASLADPVVRDPAGTAVAADGEVVQLPVGANATLHGYPLCVRPDTLYVMTPEAG